MRHSEINELVLCGTTCIGFESEYGYRHTVLEKEQNFNRCLTQRKEEEINRPAEA